MKQVRAQRVVTAGIDTLETLRDSIIYAIEGVNLTHQMNQLLMKHYYSSTGITETISRNDCSIPLKSNALVPAFHVIVGMIN